MYSPAFRALSLCLALSILTGSTAWAGEGTLPPLKRLGRGVGDRRTGAKVQLACVGEKKGTVGERGCELLQFLLTDTGGHESLVGPVLDLRYPDRRADRELRDELRCYGLFKHVTAGRFFLFSAAMMGNLGSKQRERCDRVEYSTLPEAEARAKIEKKQMRHEKTRRVLAYTFGIGSWVGMGILSVAALVPEVVAMLWGIEVYAGAFVLDAAIYPIRLLFKSGKGPLGVRGKNVAALESRAQVAWQLEPKKIGHRRFEKLVARLKLFDDRGPKTDFSASAPTGAIEVLPLIDDSLDGDATAIAVDSNPESHPSEWIEIGTGEDLGEAS